jgi:hypothetical protein
MEHEEEDADLGISSDEEAEFYYTPRTGETLPRSRTPRGIGPPTLDVFYSPISRQELLKASNQGDLPVLDIGQLGNGENDQQDLLKNPWKTKPSTEVAISLPSKLTGLEAEDGNDSVKNMKEPFLEKIPPKDSFTEPSYVVLEEHHGWSPEERDGLVPIISDQWHYRCMRWFGCTRKSQRLMWFCLGVLYMISLGELIEEKGT